MVKGLINLDGRLHQSWCGRLDEVHLLDCLKCLETIMVIEMRVLKTRGKTFINKKSLSNKNGDLFLGYGVFLFFCEKRI